MASSQDPAPSSGLGRHLRRYGPFYAIAVVVAVLAVVLPGRGDNAGDADDGKVVASGARAGAWTPASGDIEAGTGTTRGGTECKPGTRQISALSYSAPCVPKFAGENGGALGRGVDPDKIVIVTRVFPESANSQALQKELEAAGFATTEVARKIRDQFIEFLNANYELYGRKVELVEYESKFSNATTEALGGGREGACQDATLIADEMKAFAVTGGGGVFSECAAEKGLVVFGAAAYYSETFYGTWNPLTWNTTMGCDRISAHIAEYVGKRLIGKPAKWAGDPALAATVRKFGTYTPDIEEYQRCDKQTKELLRTKYKAEPGSTVSYALDISRFVDQANRAIVQFKADGVTTVVTAADPISITLMTSAATQQNYFPEWFIIGTAGQDTDQFGRRYDQKQVDGHMFGLSQLGSSTKIFGPASEAGKLYQQLNKTPIPGGTTGSLYDYTHIFNLLQAAGPALTPQNIAKGVSNLPAMGGPGFPVGKWSFAKGVDGKPDHTAIDDSREVYWDGDAPPAPDEVDKTKKGSFIEVDNGKRYDLGEWPTGEPEVYPEGG